MLKAYTRDDYVCVRVSIGSGTFSLGEGALGPWFRVGGIQSEQLQVSYYELYYASLWF